MRVGCLLILVTVALLVGGGQGLYTAISNPNPKEYTVEEYLSRRPSSKWLRLTGGSLDLTDSNYASFFGVGQISEIYVPLRPPGVSPNDVVHILVATKDPVLLQTVEDLRKIKTEAEAARFLQEHERELMLHKNIQGLIRFGIEMKEDDAQKLRRLNENLAEDFVVLADGSHPEYLWPFCSFLGGVALAGWLLTRTLKSGAKPVPSRPPPLPKLPPPLPGAR